MIAPREVGCVALVVLGVIACGGAVDGPWGICATHHDVSSCAADGCLWFQAPSHDDLCAQPVDGYTPIAESGCFSEGGPTRDRSRGCLSDDECQPGTRCVAKAFLSGAFNPSCDYAYLCAADE